MAYTIDTVTDALLERSRSRGIAMSNLMLQKLLYYSQAWHLALANAPLFNEDFEAWVHGPVVPAVFRRFKHFRWDAITDAVNPCNDAQLNVYLDSVLNSYGGYSAKQLERLTHSEWPWIFARAGVPDDEPCTHVISEDVMRVYFQTLIRTPARG